MKEKIYALLGDILYEQRVVGDGTDIHGMVLLGPGGMMDSLMAMRFIHAVERRFQVDILDDLNLDCMETADSLVEYILRHSDGRGSYGGS